MFTKIFKQIFRNKFIAGIVLLLIIGGGYFGYKALKGNKNEVRYVLATVEKGTITTSVSGSGQVSVSNQVGIKAKTSGDIIYVGAKKGQEVNSGTLLTQIDSTDAQKTVKDAETSLETAKLELDELLKPVDELTLLQAENSLIQLKESKQKAEDNLVKAYEDGFNTVVNVFFDLPVIITGINDILYSSTINKGQNNIDAYADMVRSINEKIDYYKNEVAGSYQLARTAYDKNFLNYKAVSRYSDNTVVEALVDETYETAKKNSEANRNADNFISSIKDTLTQQKMIIPTILSTHQSSIIAYTTKTNSILSSLLSIKTTIKSNRETIASAQRSIEEKELSIAKLKAGASDLSIRAKKIAIQQKEDALSDAQQKLTDYFIRAPFVGVVAEFDVKKGDSISANAAIATIITKQRIAEITLNEVDVAKVKVDQRAILTFDAVSDLTITGVVAEIDTLGTVSQGVVSYTVKITFDTQDERVKPGMSISANIITDVKTDVLIVSNSAVKSSDNSSYVEMLDDSSSIDQGKSSSGITPGSSPRQVRVQIGLSNDSSTEIVSGLKEGDQIIIQTISPSATQNQQSQSQNSNTGIRMPGMGSFGR